MNLEPRMAEYGIPTFSPVKYVESQALADDVAAFLAKGGKISVLERTEMTKKPVVTHFMINNTGDIRENVVHKKNEKT